MTRNEEHAFKTFSKLLNEKDLPGVLLFYGKERFLIDWAYKKIIKKYIGEDTKAMDLSTFDCEKTNIDDVLDALETFPVSSKKKVIALFGFSALKSESGKALKVEDEQKILKAVSNVPESSVLVIMASEVDKRKKLYKEIEKNGRAFDFDALSESDLRSFIIKHFASCGKKIEIAAIAQLIKNSGYFNKETEYTLYDLNNDIKKISAYSENDAVIASDVLVFVSENLEANIFAMIDALAAGDMDKTFSILNSIFLSGTNEYQVIGWLSSQFELMLKISEMKEEGLNLYNITNILKMHEYRVRKAFDFTGRMNKKSIKEALKLIYEMDRDIKEGRMEARLLLELFFSRVDYFIKM